VPAVGGADPDLGALLLEAIGPGTTLSESTAGVSLEQVAALIRDLHGSGAPLAGPGVESLAGRIDVIFALWATRHANSEPMSQAIPPGGWSGHELARSLATTPAATPVLLHGDLHPANVFDGGPGRGWSPSTPGPAWVSRGRRRGLGVLAGGRHRRLAGAQRRTGRGARPGPRPPMEPPLGPSRIAGTMITGYLASST